MQKKKKKTKSTTDANEFLVVSITHYYIVDHSRYLLFIYKYNEKKTEHSRLYTNSNFIGLGLFYALVLFLLAKDRLIVTQTPLNMMLILVVVLILNAWLSYLVNHALSH